MSWVASVLVVCHVGECTTQAEMIGNALPGPFLAINQWLEEKSLGSLARLDHLARGGGKIFGGVVAGGSFNYLPIDEFLSVAFAQPWEMPETIQILIQDEEDMTFTPHLHPGASA